MGHTKNLLICLIFPFFCSAQWLDYPKDFLEKCKASQSKHTSSVYKFSLQDKYSRKNCRLKAFGNLDIGLIPNIMAGEYFITNSKRHSHLITTGLVPCWAVIFYQRQTQTVAFAHYPPNAGYQESLEILYRKFLKIGISASEIEVIFASGMAPGLDGRNELTHFIQNKKIKSISWIDQGDYFGSPLDSGSRVTIRVFDLIKGDQIGYPLYYLPAYADDVLIDRSGYFERTLQKNNPGFKKIPGSL